MNPAGSRFPGTAVLESEAICLLCGHAKRNHIYGPGRCERCACNGFVPRLKVQPSRKWTTAELEARARKAITDLSDDQLGAGEDPITSLISIALGQKRSIQGMRHKLDEMMRLHGIDCGSGTPDHPPCDRDGGECSVCSVMICPHHEALHLHHDGCPACDLPHARTPECGTRCVHEDR